MQPSEELISRVMELNESLFRLKFKKALGDVDTVKQIRVQKRAGAVEDDFARAGARRREIVSSPRPARR